MLRFSVVVLFPPANILSCSGQQLATPNDLVDHISIGLEMHVR